MQNKAKYIIVEIGGNPVAIVFDHLIDHSMMADNFPISRVTGAGFVNFDEEGTPYPYGSSRTLKMGVGEDDHKALSHFAKQIGLTRS